MDKMATEKTGNTRKSQKSNKVQQQTQQPERSVTIGDQDNITIQSSQMGDEKNLGKI